MTLLNLDDVDISPRYTVTTGCPECGQPYSVHACSPAHAIVAAERYGDHHIGDEPVTCRSIDPSAFVETSGEADRLARIYQETRDRLARVVAHDSNASRIANRHVLTVATFAELLNTGLIEWTGEPATENV